MKSSVSCNTVMNSIQVAIGNNEEEARGHWRIVRGQVQNQTFQLFTPRKLIKTILNE
jgi:hypothetical protein